jgi:hypothetical protein
MSASQGHLLDAARQALRGRLQSAETELRASLPTPGMDPIARAHLDRALAHVREACIAIHEGARIRTVQKLAEELAQVDRMRATLRAQKTAADKTSLSQRP